MEAKMKIIGAGLAGLLAGNMLRKNDPVILERQSEIPNNHTALLRHRTRLVADATSIPFKKVKVQKGIVWNGQVFSKSTIPMINCYSQKVTGSLLDRSISNIDPVERFIAPKDFIAKLAMDLNIKFSYPVSVPELKFSEGNVVSTIPMPVIAKQLGIFEEFFSEDEFNFREITTANFYIENIECDIYQTIYLPEEIYKCYRASITGNKFILEFVGDVCADEIKQEVEIILRHHFKICPTQNTFSEIKINNSKYGKIRPIDDIKRKKFISHLTKEYGIYSLGRYAVWKNLLMDDVHDDIIIIQKLIENEGYFTG